MPSYRSIALALLLGTKAASAFVTHPSSASDVGVSVGYGSSTGTRLHAFGPPPMIIGPMIRKMKEKEVCPLTSTIKRRKRRRRRIRNKKRKKKLLV